MATRYTRPYSIYQVRPTEDIDEIAARWHTEVHQPFDEDPGCCELCTRRWDQPYQHPCPRSDPPGELLRGARDVPEPEPTPTEGRRPTESPTPHEPEAPVSPIPPGTGASVHAGRDPR